MDELIDGIVTGGLLGAGLNILNQAAEGEDIDGDEVIRAAIGGGIVGGIIDAAIDDE